MSEPENPREKALYRKPREHNDAGATEHFIKHDRESGAAAPDRKEEALKRKQHDATGSRAEHYTDIERRGED